MDEQQDQSVTDYLKTLFQKGAGAAGNAISQINPTDAATKLVGASGIPSFSDLANAKGITDAIPMSQPKAPVESAEDYQSASYKPPYGNEPAPQAPVAPQVPDRTDSAVDDEDDSTRKGNPKVASSHPGFNQDELEKYLMNEKGQMDKYGADKQATDFDALRAKQHGVGNTIGRALATAGDGIMQGVAGAGNPGFLEHMDAKQAHDLQMQTEMGKNLNETNMAGIKAKEGLDRQSSHNPLGNSTAQAMIPMLKQIYPGKTDAEYQAMARNPAVTEALLPEGVKLADAKARLEDARSNREFNHNMMKEKMDYMHDKDYTTRLEKDTAGMTKDANYVKAQGTLDKLGAAKGLLESGNVNNATAKQALQTALTFVATGGQRVNETEMRQLGGAHTVSNRVNQWMQGLDRGTLTPKDYADMKQVISIYENSARNNISEAADRVAKIRAAREGISPEQARKELGAAPAQSGTSPQGANEVIRTTKDGQKAVFDANTKQFLRYQ